MRIITPINFGWRFGRKSEAMRGNVIDDSAMEIVDIPHSNAKLGFNNYTESIYQFESIYKKEVCIQLVPNKRHFIRFEGVLHQAKVYLNDHFVGLHQGGYTAFEFEVTAYVVDGLNTLMVEVDSRETLNIPPFGKTIDYLTYGGIYREVYWIETPLHRIKHVKVSLLDALTNPRLHFHVDTDGGKRVNIQLRKSGVLIHEQSYAVHDSMMMQPKIELWDVDHPHMYTVRVVLDQLDDYVFQTGFKHSIFQEDGFYLNGKKIKIVGLNRHQIYPYVGYAMPKNGQISDAKILKSLGNAVRTSHYPQSKHFLDACDELGLLVFTEAPGWQYVGDTSWQQSYLNQVKEMIIEQQHHPSIILWGVRVNESGDYKDLYQTSNSLAKHLDDRQTGGVRCFSFSEQYEDVYTYNDFYHNGTNGYAKPLHEIIHKPTPYLITEFNGHMFPTKSFDTPSRQLEHAMRYAHILNNHMGNPKIAGSFGWQFVDYNTHEQFGSGDHVCYHGIMDAFRLPKPAASIYLSQMEKPYLMVLNSADIGDYDAGFIDSFVIATNCEYIEVYQNDRFVGKYYPDYHQFPHLKHPPIIIDDLYGDAYEDLNLSKTKIESLKNIAKDLAKRGGLDKLTAQDEYSPEDIQLAWQMYGKYIANWGSLSFLYTIKGFHPKAELTRKLGSYKNYTIEVDMEHTDIYIEDTFDVSRIEIQAIDDLGNLKPYAFDVISIQTNSVLEVIGETNVSLIGGKRTIWVRTKQKGIGLIQITHKNCVIEKHIHVH